jgi:hypothetical protein
MEYMIEPILDETLDEWMERTNPECKEGGHISEKEETPQESERMLNLRYKKGETVVHGIPLPGGRRIYTFEGAPTKEQIKEYFDHLYSEPGSNYWGVKEVKVVKMDGSPAYSIQLDKRHDL